MNGLYRIRLAEGETASANPHVKSLLTALDKGSEYSIDVVGKTAEIRVSGGTPKPRNGKSKYKPPVPPNTIRCAKEYQKALHTLAGCLESIRVTMRRQWQDEPPWKPASLQHQDFDDALSHYHERKARNLVVGKAVGCVIGIHKTRDPHHITTADYAILDTAVGCKVTRQSKLTTRDKKRPYLAYIVSRYGKTAAGWNGRWKKPEQNKTAEIKPLTAWGKPWNPNAGRVVTPIQECLEARVEVEYWAEMIRLSKPQELAA